MRPNRPVRLASAVLGSGVLLASFVFVARTHAGGQAPVSQTLYRGEGNTGNIRLSSWGSGRAEEDRTSPLVGDAAIKITTHGMFQGGRIDFQQPVNLAPALANSKTFLRLRARFEPQAGGNGGFPGGGFPGNSGGGGSLLDGPGGGGASSGGGQTAGGGSLQNLRYLLIMADGSQYELIRPFDLPPSDDPEAYVPIGFPVAAITKAAKGKRLAGDGARLKSLAIFADRYQQFRIGEIDLLTDDTEINVNDLDDQIAFTNNDMVFAGDAEGGASTLRFTWDWDASDGIQEDSVGRAVTHVFKQKGKYIITLTVSDVDGLKKPQTKTLELDVAE